MVNAPVEAIWSMLVDKAEHPEKYMPYKPEFLKIREAFPKGLLHEIKTAEMHMFERVTFENDTGEEGAFAWPCGVGTFISHPRESDGD